MLGLILLCVFLTSLLSGIIGMAGGMILMAILVLLLPVPAAMALHGAVQATANGSRAWILRRHIQWRILPPYLLGAAAAALVFAGTSLVPDSGLVLILVGLMPWLARLLPRLLPRIPPLNITRTPTAVVCGALVTAAQLLAGASGPLLDVFYLHTPLSRHEVVASKALTQVIGHLLKLIYYGLMLGSAGGLADWWYAAAILCALAGTKTGTRLLDRIPEAAFRRLSSQIILAIASLCIARGIGALLAKA